MFFNSEWLLEIMGLIRKLVVSVVALVLVVVIVVVLFNLFLVAIVVGIVIAIIAVIVGFFKRMQRNKFQRTMDEVRTSQKASNAGPVVDVEYKVKSVKSKE